jgi:hypothetical protein
MLSSTDQAGSFVHWPDAKNALGVSLVGLLNVMWELEHNDRQYVIIASTEGPVTTLEWAVLGNHNLPTTSRKVKVAEPKGGLITIQYLEYDKKQVHYLYSSETENISSGSELDSVRRIYNFLIEGVLQEYAKSDKKQV